MTGLEHQNLLAAGVSHDWLITPNARLGDRRPLDCLISEVIPVLPKISRRRIENERTNDGE